MDIFIFYYFSYVVKFFVWGGIDMDNRIVLDIMKSKGYNTSKLAELAGLPVSTVNRIVYGVTTNPTLDNMKRIADALGCTLDDFYSADSQAGYYIDPEVAAYAQEIFDNPELRILMDATRDVSKEDIEFITQMVLKLKQNKND